MRTLQQLPAVALAICLGVALDVRADDPGGAGPVDVPAAPADSVTRNPSSLSDAELDARIAFIEQRLDASRKHAFYWQWGWTGVYGSGLIIESIRAGVSKNDHHQIDYAVSATKAAGGVARLLLQRHPVRNGADPLRELGEDTHEAKARKLARAEELLLQSAKFSHRRWSEKSHIGNVLVNLAGGAIIWGAGAPTEGIVNAAVGISVGTAQILSAPWAGEKDLDDYKARFGGATARGWDWRLVPTAGGAAVQVDF